MIKHDIEDGLITLVIFIAIIAIIVYLIFLIATIVLGVFAAGGTLYGGGHAVKNYFSSFKENVIDDNKTQPMAA